jgi:hypothetical protein
MCLCFYPQPRLKKQIFDCSNNKTNTPTKQKISKTNKQPTKQTNRQKENRRKGIFLHDQYWVQQQLAGRRTQEMKITSNQRRQTAATAAWKYILPALCVCVKIFPSCSGMLSATKKNKTGIHRKFNHLPKETNKRIFCQVQILQQ